MKLTPEILQQKLLIGVNWRQVTNLDSCWPWLRTNKLAYPKITINYTSVHRKTYLVNRVSIFLYHDHSKGNFYCSSYPLACHSCDNKLCVNPMHLFKGTHKDNTKDSLTKGRFSIGSKSCWSRLTEENIIEIRKLRAKGLLHREIAMKYNVATATISTVLQGRSWKHVK